MTLSIVGITDEITTCQRCGKRNLKRTIILKDKDDAGAEEVYYGSDCAAIAVLGHKSKANSDRMTLRARAIQSAKRWIAEGHTVDVIIKGMTRYGFGVEHRPELGVLRIWHVGEVIGTHRDGSPIFGTVDVPLGTCALQASMI